MAQQAGMNQENNVFTITLADVSPDFHAACAEQRSTEVRRGHDAVLGNDVGEQLERGQLKVAIDDLK